MCNLTVDRLSKKNKHHNKSWVNLLVNLYFDAFDASVSFRKYIFYNYFPNYIQHYQLFKQHYQLFKGVCPIFVLKYLINFI